MEQEEVEQNWREEREIPQPEKEHPSTPPSQRKILSVITYHAVLLSSALLAFKHHTPQWAGLCVLAHYFWNSVAVESEELDYEYDWVRWRWDKFMRRKKTRKSDLELLRPTEILLSVILGFNRKNKKKEEEDKPVLIIDSNRLDPLEDGQHKVSNSSYKKLLNIMRNKKLLTNISSEAQCLFFLKSICPQFGTFLLCGWASTFISMIVLWPAVYFALQSFQEMRSKVVVYVPIYCRSINFGHFRLIKKACRYGNYISAGLVAEHGKSNIEDLKKAIFESPYVSEVIVNAPPVISPQFVNYHHISYIVVNGDELDLPDLVHCFNYPIHNS